MLFADNDTVQLVNAIGVIFTGIIGFTMAVITGYYGYKIKMKQMDMEVAQQQAAKSQKLAAVSVVNKVEEVKQNLTAHQHLTHDQLEVIQAQGDHLVKQTNGMSEQLQKAAFAAGMNEEKKSAATQLTDTLQ